MILFEGTRCIQSAAESQDLIDALLEVLAFGGPAHLVLASRQLQLGLAGATDVLLKAVLTTESDFTLRW